MRDAYWIEQAMTQDEEVMRWWATRMASRGWFVKVEASHFDKHFEVNLTPPTGWALDKIVDAEIAARAYQANQEGQP
jgi:hypothetical protein